LKTGKTLQTLAFLTIFTLSSIVIAFNFKALSIASSSGTVGPVIFVSPSLIQAEVGQNFTINVRVENLTDNKAPDPDNPTQQVPCGNLYGVDLQLGWDPTVIHCVSHTKKIPVTTYTDGVMYGPTIPILDWLDETASMPNSSQGATYWLSEASMLPALVFNGAGNFVTMTFTVLKSGRSPIKILDLTMADVYGNPIARGISATWLRPLGDATFSTPGAPTADFTFSPDIGVVNKTVTFNATSSQSNNTIVQYLWDFGDGTRRNETSPTTEHVYNASLGLGYTVTLRVTDNFGVISGAATKIVNVATKRDLKATSLTLSQESIRPNKEFNITAEVYNFGTSLSDFYENATISLYYNVTTFDLNNTSSGTWAFVDSKSTMIMKANYARPVFVVNSSKLPTIEALYYFLMNVTGVPAGYENNTANNLKLSQPLLYTLALLHKPTIFSFQCGYLFQNRAYKTPVLENETITLNVTVQNNGNDVDSFNVTFLANGTVLGTAQMRNVPEGVKALGGWSGIIAPGKYDIAVVVQAGNASAAQHVEMRIRRLPYLVIEFTPTNPVVNQEVTLNASASKHLEPTGSLDMMIWTIYKPGTDVTDGPSKAVYTIRGNANNASVNVIRYTFNMSGTWTVVLDVIDESKLTYAETRPGTRPYRLVLKIEVPEGLPIELIIGAVALVAVLVIVIAFILIRRRRSPVVQPPTE
jgi:PKD repeat protein